MAKAACFIVVLWLLVLTPPSIGFLSSVIFHPPFLDDDKNVRLKADDNDREIDSLKDWALSNGVQFMPGLDLQLQKQDDQEKEWGVVMTEQAPDPVIKSKENPVPIMLIPPSVVISSATVGPIIKQQVKDKLSLVGKGMRQYLPELCLFIRLLEEYDKGYDSHWYPWIRALPREFSTGLYMDDFERSYARQIGMGIFLDHQAEQWETFRTIYKELFPEKNDRYSNEHLQWAFSIVFTRSWTTSYKLDNEESVAVLVPLGDMFNHNSAKRNVRVVQETPTSDVTLIFTDNAKTSATDDGLYLSYGFIEWPARFIFTFGFLDTSSPAVFSNITFDTTVETNARSMGFTDASNMVFYTDDGAISDWAWLAVLHKVLLQKQKKYPHDESLMEKQNILFEACTTHTKDPLSDDRLVRCYLEHQKECVAWMLLHIESMLNTIYGPVPEFFAMDYQNHPRLEMLHHYHCYMRELHCKVRDNLPV